MSRQSIIPTNFCLLQPLFESARNNSQSGARRGARDRVWKMTSLVTLVCVCVLIPAAMVLLVDATICSSASCLNGGQMMMPTSTLCVRLSICHTVLLR